MRKRVTRERMEADEATGKEGREGGWRVGGWMGTSWAGPRQPAWKEHLNGLSYLWLHGDSRPDPRNGRRES